MATSTSSMRSSRPLTRRRRRQPRPSRLSRAAEVDLASGGRPAGALAGFANFLLGCGRASSRGRSSSAGTRWKSRHTGTRRYPYTRLGASLMTPLLEQLAMLPELVEAFGFRAARAPATRPTTSSQRPPGPRKTRADVLVVTSDRMRSSSRWADDDPQARRGVLSSTASGPRGSSSSTASSLQQVPDFIALRGDPSDKIPGARGVGPKTAATVPARVWLARSCAGGRPLPKSRRRICASTGE